MHHCCYIGEKGDVEDDTLFWTHQTHCGVNSVLEAILFDKQTWIYSRLEYLVVKVKSIENSSRKMVVTIVIIVKTNIY